MTELTSAGSRVPSARTISTRDLAHRALHPQQRRVVRLVVDAAAGAEQVLEAASPTSSSRMRPVQLLERPVDPDDRPVRRRRAGSRTARPRRASSAVSSSRPSGRRHARGTPRSRDRLLRRAEVRAVARRLEQHELLSGSCAWTYSPTASGAITSSEHCSTSAGVLHAAEVGAVVGQERHAREVRGDLRVGAAEAVRELLAELRAVRVAHDHRRHRARPAEVVALERLEQPVDVLAREAADVALVVDVARRRPDEHEAAEALGLLRRRQHADHRADRVADEHDVAQVELLADLEDVLGVALERGVALRVVGRWRPTRRRRRGRTGRCGSSSANAGHTNRHMFWSQPKPWANTIGWPSGTPCSMTLLRDTTIRPSRAASRSRERCARRSSRAGARCTPRRAGSGR